MDFVKMEGLGNDFIVLARVRGNLLSLIRGTRRRPRRGRFASAEPSEHCDDLADQLDAGSEHHWLIGGVL